MIGLIRNNIILNHQPKLNKMTATIQLTNIEKIILGYQVEELLKKGVDVFTILDILHIDYNDLENPNYEILLDVLYKNVLGRQIIWEEEQFLNNVISNLVSRKYIGLFSNYQEALADVKFAMEFNEIWWTEFETKTNFNFNSI